ncbi:MAG TPA: ATP-binding cassette domain-containing protein, partial [Pseudolabrys sp.]|nr:ATP-binding cassette domain-containing protein [Pseudolabrys sp.]
MTAAAVVSKVRTAARPGTEFLRMEKVSRHFGTLKAVDGVTFDMRAGELRAVIGPNGAGKTTFFNLISGLLPPTHGEVIFENETITQ